MKKIAFLFVLLLLLCSCSRFDQQAWLSEPDMRNAMVSNLTSTYNLTEMTESEIIDLLGEPQEKMTEPSLQLLYYIGYAGLGVKASFLHLYFDEDGLVEKHTISYK